MEKPQVLLAAPSLPAYDREGGSRRIFDIARILQSIGWQVSYFAKDIANTEQYIADLQQLGIWVGGGVASPIPPSDDWIDDLPTLLQSKRFDVAIVAFWTYAESILPIIQNFSPHTKIIVDSIDLHFLRESRRLFQHKSHANGDISQLHRRFANRFIREMLVYTQSDHVLTVSQKEANLIHDLLGINNHAFPVHLVGEVTISQIPFPNRKGILFIGNFLHAPNLDALHYFMAEIYPRIPTSILEKHPFTVIGNALTDEITAPYNGLPHTQFIGWVSTILPYISQACISVIPLRYGAGLKSKLIASLAVGTPCITTSIGAEGFAVKNGKHLIIEDDPEAFAHAIERLVTDQPLWESLIPQGIDLVSTTYSSVFATKQLKSVMESTIGKAQN